MMGYTVQYGDTRNGVNQKDKPLSFAFVEQWPFFRHFPRHNPSTKANILRDDLRELINCFTAEWRDQAGERRLCAT